MLNNIAPIFVGMAALIFGVKLLFKALSALKLANGGADSWEETTGKVLKGSYREANFGSIKSKDPKANTYLLDFEYEYEAKGKSFRSQKPLFYDLTLFEEINDFLMRFPEGKGVPVYYDPKKPSRAVLDKTIEGKNRTHRFSMGIILIAVGAILVAIRYETLQSLWSG